jgi:hypothetical protein
VKFPKVIRHRKAEVTIYGRKEAYPFYRLAYRAGGKRILRSFSTWSEVKTEAEKKVRELARGSQSPALSEKEVTAALTIRDPLDAYRRETGRTITALQAVTGYVEAMKKLGERPLSEAVEGFLSTVAVVKRKGLSDAVEEFIAGRAPKAVAKDGKRSALNPKYVENTAAWLREFAETFPGHNVGDITKEFLSHYLAEYDELSAKSRNDRRAVVKQFLKWCVRNDYLAASHRLMEADALKKEELDDAPIGHDRRRSCGSHQPFPGNRQNPLAGHSAPTRSGVSGHRSSHSGSMFFGTDRTIPGFSGKQEHHHFPEKIQSARDVERSQPETAGLKCFLKYCNPWPIHNP